MRSELEVDGKHSHITSHHGRMGARGYESPPPRITSGVVSPNELDYQSRTQAERGQRNSKLGPSTNPTARQSRAASYAASQRQSDASQRAGADLAAELNYNGPTEDPKGSPDVTLTHEEEVNKLQSQ